MTGYATGTTYAEPGVHIVGEEGPEAIFFDGGETVLDSDDTRQYLSGQRPIQTSVPTPTRSWRAEESPAGAPHCPGDRRARLLELTGGNIDEDAAAEWLVENLRPLLISTLNRKSSRRGCHQWLLTHTKSG